MTTGCGCRCRSRMSVLAVSPCEYCEGLPTTPANDFIIVTGLATTRLLSSRQGAPAVCRTHPYTADNAWSCDSNFFGASSDSISLTLSDDCASYAMHGTFTTSPGTTVSYTATVSPGWTTASLGPLTVTRSATGLAYPSSNVVVDYSLGASIPILKVDYDGNTYSHFREYAYSICGQVADSYHTVFDRRVELTWLQSADASTHTFYIVVKDGAFPATVLYVNSASIPFSLDWHETALPITIGSATIRI